MRNFKKIFVFLIIILICESVLSFMLEPVTYEHFLQKELQVKEEAGNSPDMVFIGNSRVMMDFVPSIIENKMDDVECVLNAGTGSQMPWGTYFYLKDILNQYDIKYAVVGIDYSMYMTTETRVPKRDLVVIDRIKTTQVKLDYIKSFIEPGEYLNFLKSYRYRDEIKSIPQNLSIKLNRNYSKGIDVREPAHYKDMGYIYSEEKGIPHTGIYGVEEWNRQEVSPLAMEYLIKIKELCEENGTTLFLVAPPFAFSSIYNMSSYQDCFDYFNEFAIENGIFFCDLNLIQNRAEVLPDTMLSDADHLGGQGAQIISALYADILNKEMVDKDISSYFYSSVEEMRNDIQGVIACDFKTELVDTQGDRMIYSDSIHEKGIAPEYEYWIRPEGSDSSWIKLMDYSENSQCRIPARYLEGMVTIRVNCREKGSKTAWDMQIERSRTPDM